MMLWGSGSKSSDNAKNGNVEGSGLRGLAIWTGLVEFG